MPRAPNPSPPSGQEGASPVVALRRRLSLALAGLPAACAVPDAPRGAPAPVTLPTVRVGDRWHYRHEDRVRGEILGEPLLEVVSLVPDIRMRVLRGRANGQEERYERYSSPWSAIIDCSYDEPIEFIRPMPILPIPIDAGETLDSETRYRVLGSGQTWRWTQQLAAQGWERVEVPAGAFDCLRVRRAIVLHHPDARRSYSSRSDTIWYAPQVNRWVQREWTGEYWIDGARGALPWPAARREGWMRWQLLAYHPAPTSRRGGPA